MNHTIHTATIIHRHASAQRDRENELLRSHAEHRAALGVEPASSPVSWMMRALHPLRALRAARAAHGPRIATAR